MESHTHGQHPHQHGPGCGHLRVRHGDHVDYLHDGHLHHVAGTEVSEHGIEVGATNPAECRKVGCTGNHEARGSEKVPHGDHVDFLVDGHLHHVHGDHCDDHGELQLA